MMHALTVPAGSFAVQADHAGRIVLAEDGPYPRVVVFSGYVGPPLPRAVTARRVEQVGPGAWRLTAEEGTFDFDARGMELLEPQPGLFDDLLSGFALKQRDRRLVGVLLRLLRLPGGAWLLRRWHVHRR